MKERVAAQYLDGQTLKTGTVYPRAFAVPDEGELGVQSYVPFAIGNSSDEVECTFAQKVKVVDVICRKVGGNGGVGDVAVLTNDGNTVVSLDLHTNAKNLVRPSALDNVTVAAGDVLKLATTSVTNCACDVTVIVVPVA